MTYRTSSMLTRAPGRTPVGVLRSSTRISSRLLSTATSLPEALTPSTARGQTERRVEGGVRRAVCGGGGERRVRIHLFSPIRFACSPPGPWNRSVTEALFPQICSRRPRKAARCLATPSRSRGSSEKSWWSSPGRASIASSGKGGEREREPSAAAGRGRGGRGRFVQPRLGRGVEGVSHSTCRLREDGPGGAAKLAAALRAPRLGQTFCFRTTPFFPFSCFIPKQRHGRRQRGGYFCSLSLSLSLCVFQTHPRSPPTVLSNARESGVRPRRGAIGLHLLAQPQRVPRQAIDIDSFPSERPSLGPPGLDPVLNCHREAFSGNFGAEKGVPSVSRPNDKREKREILIKRRPEISRAG